MIGEYIDYSIDLLIELLKHVLILEATLHDGCTLQVGTKLGRHPLHNSLWWHSKIGRHFLHVENVGLDTVQTRLLLQVHLHHFVSEKINRV